MAVDAGELRSLARNAVVLRSIRGLRRRLCRLGGADKISRKEAIARSAAVNSLWETGVTARARTENASIRPQDRARPAAQDGPRRIRPQDATTSSWQVRQGAALPSGRARQVAEHAHEVLYHSDPDHHTRADFPRDHWWLLALIYCMLAEEHPDLPSNQGELRTAVEADDLVAVHTVMDPWTGPPVWRPRTPTSGGRASSRLLGP